MNLNKAAQVSITSQLKSTFFTFNQLQRGTKRFTSLCLVGLLLWLQTGCGGGGSYPGGGGSTTPNSSASARPHFAPGFNLFSPQQDIEMGRQSAQQVSQQAPLLRDEQIVNYIKQLGAKLAAKAPGEKFPYQFNVVATKEINAFALPGGFTFVNAGAIIAAKNEGELAGVMAHEISHVALRHGTNQASKAYIAKAGLGVLGAVAGGRDNPDMAQVINTVGGAGANMLFLKFGRTAEKQADLEGARIMADAGYDPHDMANFFKTLQEKGGQRVPEFLSDHPDPGNRIAAINAEIPSLHVGSNAVHTSPAFEQVKARLMGASGGGNLKSSGDGVARTGPSNPDDMKSGTRPPTPVASFSQFRAKDGSYALTYPQNWDVLTADQTNLIFAPKGAYGQAGQSIVVTHGMFVGTMPAQSRDLQAANNAFVQQQINVNPDFRIARQPQQINFNGRAGYATVVGGPSTVTGVVEIDVIYTTATSDGHMFYLITIAPEDEYKTYQPFFEQIVNSLQVP